MIIGMTTEQRESILAVLLPLIGVSLKPDGIDPRAAGVGLLASRSRLPIAVARDSSTHILPILSRF